MAGTPGLCVCSEVLEILLEPDQEGLFPGRPSDPPELGALLPPQNPQLPAWTFLVALGIFSLDIVLPLPVSYLPC